MPTYEEAHSNHSHKKSFSRLLSKEVSQPNSSCRVYYGEAAGAIPFVWESQPGTPKHALFEYSSSYNMPPLTPPPSFSSNGGSKLAMKRSASTKPPRLDLLMSSIFHRSSKARRPGSFSLSSLSSSSSSSNSWPFDHGNECAYDHDRDRDHDSGEFVGGSPTSTLCFPAAAVKKSSAWRLVFGCYAATVSVKNARVKNSTY